MQPPTLSSFASGVYPDYSLTANQVALATGSYHLGSPDHHGVAARHGLSVTPGEYTVDVVMRLHNRRIIGMGPDLGTYLPCSIKPGIGGENWLAVGYGTGGRTQCSGLTFDADERTARGVLLNGCHMGWFNEISVKHPTLVGIDVEKCVSLQGARGWLVQGASKTRLYNGLPVDGIRCSQNNGLWGANWRVSDVSGNGIIIEGDYSPGSSAPWGWAGGMSVNGLVVERVGGAGVIIRHGIKGVHLGGIVWIEGGSGPALVIDRVSVTTDVLSLQTNSTEEPCLKIINGGRLHVRECYIGSPAAGVYVERGSRLYGSVYTYPGGTVAPGRVI